MSDFSHRTAGILDWVNLTRVQAQWAAFPVAERVSPLRELRSLLIDRAADLFAALDDRNTRTLAEFTGSELISLAEACKWHQSNAARILKPRAVRHLGLNPFIGRIGCQVIREPLGKVLIIGTWNYPVFLSGVQILQALVAGNAVLIKPAPGTEKITKAMIECFRDAGYQSDLLQVLGSEPEEVDVCLERGIDMVILTASSKTGRLIATKAAEHLVPVIAELSGCDAMFVLDDADLKRVANCVAMGVTLNQGSTCMAPRRVIVGDSQAERLVPLVIQRLKQMPEQALRAQSIDAIAPLLEEAISQGAKVIYPESNWNANSLKEFQSSAIVVDHVRSEMSIAQKDYFAPVVSILRQRSENVADWIACDQRCPYALSATIFGSEAKATELAKKINVGMVTINDIFAPTVEPSLSFGGRKESGYGVTRGEEGLRQLTREKSIVVRHGNFLPHLQGRSPQDDDLVGGLFRWLHGRTIGERIAGLRQLIKAGRAQSLSKSKNER